MVVLLSSSTIRDSNTVRVSSQDYQWVLVVVHLSVRGTHQGMHEPLW